MQIRARGATHLAVCHAFRGFLISPSLLQWRAVQNEACDCKTCSAGDLLIICSYVSSTFPPFKLTPGDPYHFSFISSRVSRAACVLFVWEHVLCVSLRVLYVSMHALLFRPRSLALVAWLASPVTEPVCRCDSNTLADIYCTDPLPLPPFPKPHELQHANDDLN